MQVGSIVECISYPARKSTVHINKPVVGGVYIVREIREALDVVGRIGILLEEIYNNKVEFYPDEYPGLFLEPAFLTSHFRELLPPSDKSLTIDDIIKEKA